MFVLNNNLTVQCVSLCLLGVSAWIEGWPLVQSELPADPPFYAGMGKFFFKQPFDVLQKVLLLKPSINHAPWKEEVESLALEIEGS